jgi:hypothetical protein
VQYSFHAQYVRIISKSGRPAAERVKGAAPKTMSSRHTRDALASQVKKLDQITAELRQGASFNITRLIVVKRLCAEPSAAARFALYLAERTRARMLEKAVPSHLMPERWECFKALVNAGVEAMRRYLDEPMPEAVSALRTARSALQTSQSQYQHQQWGPPHNWRVTTCLSRSQRPAKR